MCRWFDSALGHQDRKPLILHRIEGFFTSWGSLTAWIGTPSRYTVALSCSTRGIAKTQRRRSFMAQPIKHKTTGIFQLRRKVPEALRKALGREYKRSLGTRDPAGRPRAVLRPPGFDLRRPLPWRVRRRAASRQVALHPWDGTARRRVLERNRSPSHRGNCHITA